MKNFILTLLLITTHSAFADCSYKMEGFNLDMNQQKIIQKMQERGFIFDAKSENTLTLTEVRCHKAGLVAPGAELNQFKCKMNLSLSVGVSVSQANFKARYAGTDVDRWTTWTDNTDYVANVPVAIEKLRACK